MCLFPLQLEEDFVKANPDWVKELEIMVRGVLSHSKPPPHDEKAAADELFLWQWITEIHHLDRLQVTTKVKAEIQALSSFGFQYLSHEYLPLKLQEGDWI